MKLNKLFAVLLVVFSAAQLQAGCPLAEKYNAYHKNNPNPHKYVEDSIAAIEKDQTVKNPGDSTEKDK